MKNFKDNLNITKLKPGSWRSMLGYAGQEIALGRLLSCGFNVARSLWRDGKRIGNNIEIIINENFETSIDIHDEFDFFLAEKALEYLKKHSPEKVNILLRLMS